MAVLLAITIAVLLNAVSGFVADNGDQSKMKCQYYNATCIRTAQSLGKSDDHCREDERICTEPDDICYVVWHNSSNSLKHASGHNVQLMGCLQGSENHECFDNDICRGEEKANNHFMCCCKTSMCNAKFNFAPPKSASRNAIAPGPTEHKKDDSQLKYLYALPLILVLLAIFGIGFYVWKKKKEFNSQSNASPDEEGMMLAGAGDGERDPKIWLPKDATVELLETKAQGRYGKVWKGRLQDKAVAVKIMTEKASWASEMEVYSLASLNSHDNVLRFFYADHRTQEIGQLLSQEYWIITEFHERGSLCDFLKTHMITWEELCKLALSIGKGLAFLHEEIQDTKPSIVHRDFKSKNVLIKSDMTACIADFGLAMIFKPGEPIGDRHGQVGTRRYMAPEVLEGAMSFTKDAFQRIDMYACGLVFWELASRCQINLSGEESPPAYKLPFEDEIANNPATIDTIMVSPKKT